MHCKVKNSDKKDKNNNKRVEAEQKQTTKDNS